MQAFRAVKNAVDFILKWFCILLLGVMTILVIYQVFARQVLQMPSPVTEILSQYMFVWLVMLGGAYVFGLREHLNLTLLKDKFSPLLNMFVEILIYLTLLAFAVGVNLYGGIPHTRIQMGTLDSALQIPFGLIFSVIPIGGGLIVFYSIYNCALAIYEYASGKKTTTDDTNQSTL